MEIASPDTVVASTLEGDEGESDAEIVDASAGGREDTSNLSEPASE